MVIITLDFLTYLLYFQMKTQLFILIDINIFCGCAFVKKSFAQVVQVHIFPDESVFKGLQQELITSIRILLVIY